MDAPNYLADIWEAAKTAGPFGTLLMLVIWFKTDRERLKLQGERNALQERTLLNNEKMLAAMEALFALVKKERRP